MRFLEPNPRKGTETHELVLLFFKQLLEGFLEPNPRKGTETSYSKLASSLSPMRFLEPNPRKGTETKWKASKNSAF